MHGDAQLGDFATWLKEQSDKTYPEAKATLLKLGKRRTIEMTPGEQRAHERAGARKEKEMDAQSCDFHIGECDKGDIDDCQIACKECDDDDSCAVVKKRKPATRKTTKKPAAKPKPKRKAPAKKKVSTAIKKITNNMPAGYSIHKWSYEDSYNNRHTAHAVMYKGKTVFGQNKTFESLTVARKALKEHLSSERSREQNRKDREQLKKHGHLGKSGHIDKPKKVTKVLKDITSSLPAGYSIRQWMRDGKKRYAILLNGKLLKAEAGMYSPVPGGRAVFESLPTARAGVTKHAKYVADKRKPKPKKKVIKTVKAQTGKRKKRSAQTTMSGKKKPQKKPAKAKKCVKVTVKSHTRKCPTRGR